MTIHRFSLLTEEFLETWYPPTHSYNKAQWTLSFTLQSSQQSTLIMVFGSSILILRWRSIMWSVSLSLTFHEPSSLKCCSYKQTARGFVVLPVRQPEVSASVSVDSSRSIELLLSLRAGTHMSHFMGGGQDFLLLQLIPSKKLRAWLWLRGKERNRNSFVIACCTRWGEYAPQVPIVPVNKTVSIVQNVSYHNQATKQPGLPTPQKGADRIKQAHFSAHSSGWELDSGTTGGSDGMSCSISSTGKCSDNLQNFCPLFISAYGSRKPLRSALETAMTKLLLLKEKEHIYSQTPIIPYSSIISLPFHWSNILILLQQQEVSKM